VTVPYDPAFDRHAKHPLGFYHGASLTALTTLCAAHGYDLVGVSEAGLNAVFCRRDLTSADGPMRPVEAYRQNALRNRWHGMTAHQQWESVSHLPFVRVSSSGTGPQLHKPGHPAFPGQSRPARAGLAT
jgi:hypothetical protein